MGEFSREVFSSQHSAVRFVRSGRALTGEQDAIPIPEVNGWRQIRFTDYRLPRLNAEC
jgi:hypothetical protein